MICCETTGNLYAGQGRAGETMTEEVDIMSMGGSWIEEVVERRVAAERIMIL